MGGKKSVNRQNKDGRRKIGSLGASDDCVVVPGLLGRQIRFALAGSGENGPVRILSHRVGELANLPDPETQRRSCAAILAKKHCEHSQRLRNIYNAMARRELTLDEIDSVFAIIRSLYGHDSEPGEIKPARTDDDGWISPGVGGGCPSPDNPEPDQSHDDVSDDTTLFALESDPEDN